MPDMLQGMVKTAGAGIGSGDFGQDAGRGRFFDTVRLYQGAPF
jgi:hypothetical protein